MFCFRAAVVLLFVLISPWGGRLVTNEVSIGDASDRLALRLRSFWTALEPAVCAPAYDRFCRLLSLDVIFDRFRNDESSPPSNAGVCAPELSS